MDRTLGIALAVVGVAVSCGGSEPPGVIERRASAADEDVLGDQAVCEQVERFALGSHAGDDLTAVVDELGRLAALLDVGEALAHLHAWRTANDDETDTAAAIDAAADLIDASGVPALNAMQASTSSTSCFGRAPTAPGSAFLTGSTCAGAARPACLPCFQSDGGFHAVDCRNGKPEVLQDGAWATPP